MQTKINFFNTNNETGATLTASKVKAAGQQGLILEYFEAHMNGYFNPFDIQYRVKLNAPITSIRRAMTNLEKVGKIIKTSKMKSGKYGKQNHTWKLA